VTPPLKSHLGWALQTSELDPRGKIASGYPKSVEPQPKKLFLNPISLIDLAVPLPPSPPLIGGASKDWGSCHQRQKPQAPTPQAPIRNRQTRKAANAKGLNRNTNLT